MKRMSFGVLVLEGLVGLHRTIQLHRGIGQGDHFPHHKFINLCEICALNCIYILHINFKLFHIFFSVNFVEAESQETPGVTGKFGLGVRNEAGQRLIEFCQENALVIANILFQQHKRRLYIWTLPDGQH